MSEEDRPNKKYALSNPDNSSKSDKSTEGLNFYYNRQRRLENAPESVQDLYIEKKPSGRFGLLGPLVADKPRRILFFSIIFLCLLIFIITRLGLLETTYILGGNIINVSATNFEGTTILILRKNARDGAYTGPVEIAVTVAVQDIEEQFPVFYHRIFFTLEREEEYRFAIPFDSPQLLMILQNETDNLYIRINPE